MIMAQEPQTSSRQLESYAIGVVGLPSRVTGLAAMSISAEVTFMPGRYDNSNSSQWGFDSGDCRRLILMITVLEFAIFVFLLVFTRNTAPVGQCPDRALQSKRAPRVTNAKTSGFDSRLCAIHPYAIAASPSEEVDQTMYFADVAGQLHLSSVLAVAILPRRRKPVSCQTSNAALKRCSTRYNCKQL